MSIEVKCSRDDFFAATSRIITVGYIAYRLNEYQHSGLEQSMDRLARMPRTMVGMRHDWYTIESTTKYPRTGRTMLEISTISF